MSKVKKKDKTYEFVKSTLSLTVAVLLAVCVWILLFAPKDYNEFLDCLAVRESSDDYAAENRYGYLGRYQMGGLALRDAGFLDQDGAWTELANSYGIFSDSDFLNSPAGQEAAIRAYHRELCRYIRAYGLEQYVGSQYCDVTVTESGLLAASHLVGVRKLKAALAADTMVYDGNFVSAREYMELFSGFDVSAVWDG